MGAILKTEMGIVNNQYFAHEPLKNHSGDDLDYAGVTQTIKMNI